MIDPTLNRLQSYVFHWLIQKVASTLFHDISYVLQGIKRNVCVEIDAYGDLCKCIPILDDKYGIRFTNVVDWIN
jgi:hypothetical protein